MLRRYVSAVILFELPLSNAVTATAIVRPVDVGFDETDAQKTANVSASPGLSEHVN